MDQRKQIMIAFQYEENSIGVTYYILNIIRALNVINDSDKPELTILHNPGSSMKEIERIGYPYMKFLSFESKVSFHKRLINRAFYLLTGQLLFKIRVPKKLIRNFYPFFHTLDQSNISTYYAWIGDFQEYYLPQFFSRAETLGRKLSHRNIVKSGIPVVFSSYSALSDFDKFYPGNKNRKAILRFASIINPKYELLQIATLKEKYGIKHRYFIVTNQFWKHKNHETVIKAYELLSKSEPEVQLVLTGKEHDYRNPEYPGELKKQVLERNRGNQILFLGFIDRDEQLKLMKESVAIVQPSLFEGWSTVVEDSKALQKFILLSNLQVHLEQIDSNCRFFDPHNVEDLAGKMKELLERTPATNPVDYQQAIRSFALDFLSLFEEGADK